MKVQTFIFVHDQQIIIDFEKIQKFSMFKDFKYVFLGSRPIDQIEHMENVIIARNYEPNIEEHNSRLISFTGTWLLWKHKLYDADYLNLFEYDINVVPDFCEQLESNLIKEKPSIVGYIPLPVSSWYYINEQKLSKLLIDSIAKHYGIDVKAMVQSMSPQQYCTVTSNHTYSAKALNDFMTWMEPMIDDIKLDKYAGHMTERAVSFFYFIKRMTDIQYIPGVLHHFQMDTHNTQDVPATKFADNYQNLLNNKI
jgi:hypothetical protein